MDSSSLSEISETDTIQISVDLVSAARRNIGFLRTVSECQWLHRKPMIIEAIRRYEEVWMPLISDLTVETTPPMILPPVDIEWVWFCHTLNPVSYRQYCESKFSKIIGKPAIFDQENEEYAVMRCKELWVRKYPSESFEIDDYDLDHNPVLENKSLFTEIEEKQKFIFSKFSGPYMSEIVLLIAARQRYKRFLLILQRFSDECSCFVPTLDILLMWLTHQSYPTVYTEDLYEMCGKMGKVAGISETAEERDIKKTQEIWDRIFDEPYEKAGGPLALKLDMSVSDKSPFYWVVSDSDVNTKYKSMRPRFMLEVCVFARLNPKTETKPDSKRNFLRLGVTRCHRDLKLDQPISNFSNSSWMISWRLYCEFNTRGLILELHGSGRKKCFKGSKTLDSVAFPWNDLIRANSLALERKLGSHVRLVVSITPPVQTSYLLKCVPDRVTDDSGAMISDVILTSNRYRPQEGRWLSRTVLDHAGRECFVVRIRIGQGFWRRGGETPLPVKREERIIEIREGSWSYIAGSIGRAPEKVVGTATPKEPSEEWQAAWEFSTGHDFMMMRFQSSTSISNPSFCLKSRTSPDCSVMLLTGRRMQFQVKKNRSSLNSKENNESDEEDKNFLTLVRLTENYPTGKATALINWKLLAIELLPEEDAVLVLLLCVALLRSLSEARKEDFGNLLVRTRLKEAKKGTKDWSSVMLHAPSISDSTYLEPWYWNPKIVVAPQGADHVTKQSAYHYSPVEGGDKLYKQAIL